MDGLLSPRKSLEDSVQETWGLLANQDRGNVLPMPDGQGGLLAPQWIYEMAKAVSLPGHVQRGGAWSPEDVTNMALTVGGSAGAASLAGGVPKGALGMGAASRPAADKSRLGGLGRTLKAHSSSQRMAEKPAGTINSTIGQVGGQADDALLQKYFAGDWRLVPEEPMSALIEKARNLDPLNPEKLADLMVKNRAELREKSIPNAIAAARFADEAEAMGLIPKIEWDRGGSAYVTLSRPNLTKSGAVHKTKPTIPIKGKSGQFKARFADHAQYYGATISVDPVSGNSLDDALNAMRWASGDRSTPPPEVGRASIIPGDGNIGKYRGRTPLASSGTPAGLLAPQETMTKDDFINRYGRAAWEYGT